MNIRFFSGGAGCGKTYQIMNALTEYIHNNPLFDEQKVLALTYMHGSRKRMHERLSKIKLLNQKYECIVIDSFAWRIVSRWKSLLISMNFLLPKEGEFDQICDAAGLLLENPIVAKWTVATYPIMIVDEAQDLNSVRLRIVKALSHYMESIVAADEFQCLDENLYINPTCEWLNSVAITNHLTISHRTTQSELLVAANAIRTGNALSFGKIFQVKLAPNAALAGTILSNEVGWYCKQGKVAIITPSAGQYATSVTEWVASKMTKQENGPFKIVWEHSELKEIQNYLVNLNLPENIDAIKLKELIYSAQNDRVYKDISNWLDKQRRTKGRTEFNKYEVVKVINQSFNSRKHEATDSASKLIAMTIHGAKNREFDSVIVLWPASVKSFDNEKKRRLLYNAVTRAKLRCLVLVQSKSDLELSPFV